MMKKWCYIFLVAVCILIFGSVNQEIYAVSNSEETLKETGEDTKETAEDEEKLPELTISQKVKSVYIGTEFTLTVNREEKETVWSSSDEKIAIVSQAGVVNPVDNGTAVITATSGDETVTCKVTVKNFKLNKTKAVITAGKTAALKITGTGKNAVIWKSADTSIASVSKSGVVTGKKAGTVGISAICKNKAVTCKVTVKKNERVLYDFTVKVSELPDNSAFIAVKKIWYSGSDIKMKVYLYNNYDCTIFSISDVTFQLYKNGKKIGSQSFSNKPVNAAAHSVKSFTLTIKAGNIRVKNMDLRITKVTCKAEDCIFRN